MLSPRAALTALALIALPHAAWAQTPPPAALPPAPEALPSPPPSSAPAAVPQAPPAGYAPPPAGYAPPPAGYAPPPAGYAPPAYVYPPDYRARAPQVEEEAETLPYRDGYLIPPGYHRESRVKKGLVIAGAITFGAIYTVSVVGAAGTSDGKAMFVPVLGPFIQLGNLDAGSLGPLVGAILVLNGLTQGAGAAMLIAGLAGNQEVLVRNPVVARATVRVTPLTMGYGGMGAGIGIVGTM